MLDHLLESSLGDDSNRWSNIEIGEEIEILEIEIRTLSGALNILSPFKCTCSYNSFPLSECRMTFYRAPDKVHEINFNQIYLCYFSPKTYV